IFKKVFDVTQHGWRLPFNGLDFVKLAPQLSSYKKPIPLPIICYAVKFVVVLFLIRIYANKINLSLNGARLRVDDNDNIFGIDIGVYLSVDIFQFIQAVYRSAVIIYLNKTLFSISIFVEKIKPIAPIRFDNTVPII